MNTGFFDMHIAIVETTAAPALASAVEAIFAKRMATALLDGEPVDPDDDVACIIRLSCCSFGERLIGALLPEAQNIARQRMAACGWSIHR